MKEICRMVLPHKMFQKVVVKNYFGNVNMDIIMKLTYIIKEKVLEIVHIVEC